MEIVVNEWLLDYMCSDTEPNKKSLAIQFLNTVVKKCDKIVIVRTMETNKGIEQTPFVSKFYSYMKKYNWDVNFKKNFKKLNLLLFHNSDKTKIFDYNDIKKLSKKIEEKTPIDDKYLIELVYSTNDKIFVTTDKLLKEKLKDEVDIKIYLLDEFLEEYLS